MILLLACVGKTPSVPAAPLPDEIMLAPGAHAPMAVLSASPPAADARPEEVLVPVGRWVRAGSFIGYTYVDPEMGLSVQGTVPIDQLPDPAAVQLSNDARSSLIVRLSWRPSAMQEILEAERVALGLPAEPEWLRFYGPQVPPGSLWGTWRLDPRLRERFHPDYPDDLQVMIDDEPPSPKGFEVVWVRLTGCEGDRCRGTLLNRPFHVTSVQQGDTLQFSADVETDAYPVMLR